MLTKINSQERFYRTHSADEIQRLSSSHYLDNKVVKYIYTKFLKETKLGDSM